MKKQIIMTAIGFLSPLAQASYQCVGYNRQDHLAINERHLTHLGNASATLVSNGKTQYYFGNLAQNDNGVSTKKVIELNPFQGDKVTIVTRPKMCGRGSCDDSWGVTITASLKIGDSETFFSCDENSN